MRGHWNTKHGRKSRDSVIPGHPIVSYTIPNLITEYGGSVSKSCIEIRAKFWLGSWKEPDILNGVDMGWNMI